LAYNIIPLYVAISILLTLAGGFIYITAWGDKTLEKWGARLFFGGCLWPCLVGYFVVPALIWLGKHLIAMWKAAQWKRN
jgi:hypothetical protein